MFHTSVQRPGLHHRVCHAGHIQLRRSVIELRNGMYVERFKTPFRMVLKRPKLKFHLGHPEMQVDHGAHVTTVVHRSDLA